MEKFSSVRLWRHFSVALPEPTHWLCTVYKHKRRTAKPYSLGSKKPRFRFSAVLTKNLGFRFRYGFRHSTNGNLFKLLNNAVMCFILTEILVCSDRDLWQWQISIPTTRTGLYIVSIKMIDYATFVSYAKKYQGLMVWMIIIWDKFGQTGRNGINVMSGLKSDSAHIIYSASCKP